MDIEKWERYGLLTGPVLVVLLLVGALLPGQPPDLDAPGSEVREYLIDQSTQLQTSAVLGAIAALFGIWWIASVWRAMTLAEHGQPRLALIAALGFLGGGLVAGVNAGLVAAGSLMGEELTPELARFLWVSGITVFGSGAYLFSATALAVGLLVVRQRFVAIWFGYASLVLAAAWAIGGLVAGFDAAWLMPFVFGSFLGMMAWVLAFTALLWRNRSTLDLRTDDVAPSVKTLSKVG